MSRFSKLEFGDEEHRAQPQHTEVVKDERYYLVVARERLEDGNYESALRFYSRALEFDTQLAGAWLGQIVSLIELNEPNEALVWADKGLEQFRNDPEMLAAKGVAVSRLGDLDKALALSDAALAEKGASAYRWRTRGDVLLARQDRNSRFCFDKALTQAAGDWYEPMAIGRVQLYHRHHAAALRFFEMAVDRNGSSAYLWENLGRCYDGLGRRQSAIQAYQNAVDLERQRSVATTQLLRLQNQGLLSRLRSLLTGWFSKGDN